jgi:hypothetical protein
LLAVEAVEAAAMAAVVVEEYFGVLLQHTMECP